MSPGLKKICSALFWLVMSGMLFFPFFLIDQDSFFYFIKGRYPGTVSVFVALGLIMVLYLVFRNVELMINALIGTSLAFIVTAGIGFFFQLGRNLSYPWIILYGANLFLCTSFIYALHHGVRGPKWLSSAGFQLICLGILLSGFLVLLLTGNREGKMAGLVLTGLASTLLYSVYLPKTFYKQFFSKRINRGMHPLTFLQVVQTLWTYFILVMGSVLLGFLGTMIYALWFTDIEWRKTVFHYMVMYYSRFFIWIIPLFPKLINDSGERFRKPAVIISNHQSLIDTALLFRLCPKAIILTNDWVYNSPVFGHISKLADYYNVSAGIDQIFEKLTGRVKAGYSILVFPEGTRSISQKIQRFHRGAFYIAEKLDLDIVPILFCGTGEFLKKGEFWGKGHEVCQKIFPRIHITDKRFGENYSKRAKQVRRYLAEEYEKLKAECFSSGYS